MPPTASIVNTNQLYDVDDDVTWRNRWTIELVMWLVDNDAKLRPSFAFIITTTTTTTTGGSGGGWGCGML